jgi:hypothetical protein
MLKRLAASTKCWTYAIPSHAIAVMIHTKIRERRMLPYLTRNLLFDSFDFQSACFDIELGSQSCEQIAKCLKFAETRSLL